MPFIPAPRKEDRVPRLPCPQFADGEPVSSELRSWGRGLCRASRLKWVAGDAYLSLGEMETRGLKQP